MTLFCKNSSRPVIYAKISMIDVLQVREYISEDDGFSLKKYEENRCLKYYRNMSSGRFYLLHNKLCGLNSSSHFASMVWYIVPNNRKVHNSVNLFKLKIRIRTWIPTACYCKLCIAYIQRVAYVDTFSKLPSLNF